MNHTVGILEKQHLTHDVIRLRLTRPSGYHFTEGQATEVCIGELPGRAAPFTFTGLNTAAYLELMFKVYPQHHGMTLALSAKDAGDELTIGDPWDSFINKGPGVFIAGGAGVTPFVALLRGLRKEDRIGGSQLFWSNKTTKDIFLQEELHQLLGKCYVNIITRPFSHGKGAPIDRAFLRQHISDYSRPFYICGPPGFVEDMQQHLAALGVMQELVDISL